MTVGVLALQGAFKEHLDFLNELGVKTLKVRTLEELNEVDGLILPGGESTVMGKLLKRYELEEPLIRLIQTGLPVWGTCAGMILLSQNHNHLQVMDIDVKRNAYGNQLGSFIKHKRLSVLDDKPLPLAFIRAPYIESLGDSVEVLCELDGRIVAAKEKNMLVTSFHPEVTNDKRMHQYFLDMIENRT